MNELNQHQEQQDTLTHCVTLSVIVRLFAKLYARYGGQWESQWRDENILKLAHAEWYEELKHFKVGDIKRGLDTYRGDFPPNLMQFSKACKKPTTCAAHKELKQIAPMRVSKEHARENLSRLKKAINGANVIVK